MLDIRSLPNDVKSLKSIIQEQYLSSQTKDQELQNKDQEIQNFKDENEYLREQLRLANMRTFGVKSEVYPGSQSELFDEAEVLKPKIQIEEPEDTIDVGSYKKKKPKRKPLPKDLPRENVVIDLKNEEKFCETDGVALKEIGEEISEQLDIIPQQIKVIRTIRKKYACPCCESYIKTAELPERILPKSNATPGLLAHIAINKYLDALPLYRQEQIFKRYQIDLPRNTMAGWLIKLSEKLIPLYNIMQDDLISSDYVCCDETKVQVLKESGKKAQSKSYMWVRTRHGPNIRPIVLFDYDPTRAKEVPTKLLEGFKGYLQVDGYAGYDEFCKNDDVIRVGCMAHVRRKFMEVIKTSKNKSAEAQYIIKQIQELYKIENLIEEKSIQERFAIRNEKSSQILTAIESWLNENQPKYPPKSGMGSAIQYAKNQWPHILNYLKDGRLSIDNNFTENRIRPFALGRKNWLFSDSVGGAKASGILYSVIQTARASGLGPFAYMKHLLSELPLCKTADQIANLAPHKIDPKLIN